MSINHSELRTIWLHSSGRFAGDSANKQRATSVLLGYILNQRSDQKLEASPTDM